MLVHERSGEGAGVVCIEGDHAPWSREHRAHPPAAAKPAPDLTSLQLEQRERPKIGALFADLLERHVEVLGEQRVGMAGDGEEVLIRK